MTACVVVIDGRLRTGAIVSEMDNKYLVELTDGKRKKMSKGNVALHIAPNALRTAQIMREEYQKSVRGE